VKNAEEVKPSTELKLERPSGIEVRDFCPESAWQSSCEQRVRGVAVTLLFAVAPSRKDPRREAECPPDGRRLLTLDMRTSRVVPDPSTPESRRVATGRRLNFNDDEDEFDGPDAA
jgi:hypothetical protein